MDEFELYNGAYAGPQIDEAIGKVLNPDATPTQNSTNLVTSGGVASAVSDATELKVGDIIQYTDALNFGISNTTGASLAIPVTTPKRIPAGVALTATNIQINWIRGNGTGYGYSSITGTVTITSENSCTLELKTLSLPALNVFAVYFSYTLTVVSA